MENGVNFLEGWIRRLLALPPGELAARYCTPAERDETIERELEALKAPHVPPHDRYRSIGEAPDRLLRDLHRRLRGTACEQSIWGAVVFELAHPLPDDVAHDLVDRADDLELLLEKIGHTRQSDAVQWRLAGRVDEALLTLGVEIYADPARDAAAFRGFMERAAEQPSRAYGWLLDTLVRREPSSPEKERLLADALERHPDRESLRALLEETRLLTRARDPALDAGEAEALFATGEPGVLRALAGNPGTPTGMLERLHATGGRTILLALAENPSAPTELLRALAHLEPTRRQRRIRDLARIALKVRGERP